MIGCVPGGLGCDSGWFQTKLVCFVGASVVLRECGKRYAFAI